MPTGQQSETVIRSLAEFERWYFPYLYLYERRVRYAAKHGIGHWLARSVIKAAKGARVPETPAGFYRDVELAAQRLGSQQKTSQPRYLAGATR